MEGIPQRISGHTHVRSETNIIVDGGGDRSVPSQGSKGTSTPGYLVYIVELWPQVSLFMEVGWKRQKRKSNHLMNS